VDFGRTSYHPVFNNGSFELGGLFYDPWWLNLKNVFHRFINIDGEPVVFFDFSAMHIHLLYDRKGPSCQEVFNPLDEPYSLSTNNSADREVLKRALLVLLNTGSGEEMLRAISWNLRTNDYAV
jgi:hypothetical protein